MLLRKGCLLCSDAEVLSTEGVVIWTGYSPSPHYTDQLFFHLFLLFAFIVTIQLT